MNLVPATVGRDGALHIDGVEAGVTQCALPEGTPLTLGIRPEAIVLSTTPGRGIAASVDLVEELGGSRVAYCNLAGREIAVVLPAGDEKIDGQTVYLTFPATVLHGFDRVSGKRLEADLLAGTMVGASIRKAPETV